MGMFDQVVFECPECQGRIEVQSKAGRCTLENFPAEEVPLKIALDIQGDVAHCECCDRHFTIERTLLPTTVSMRLR